jgi:hypothetical protein
MIAVVLVIIGIVAAFALGIIAAYLYMGEDDTSGRWDDEERGKK